ncbi:hypothetical protein F0267_25890 [Vibrio coralliilyticus]|uniref:hypothetical protein n=1 Tax=Vibrio TaxID=662 RepID=UPI00148DE6AA|nr:MULTISPECIES: hypothetical protein [Vibrio]NOH26201.1 hypothetical protein [Vibrio europaeus]NOH41661.1 hypothetical protein [Vibrio coralliilyticus]
MKIANGIKTERATEKDLSFFVDRFESVLATKTVEDEIESYIRHIELDIQSKGKGTKEQVECLSYLYSVKTKVVFVNNQTRKR